MIKTIIIEDYPGDSKKLKELLKHTDSSVEVVAECTNAESAFREMSVLKPDLIFLDIDLGAGETGFDLLKKFDKPDFAVIFTTQHNNTNNAIRAIRSCALDFLPKPVMQAELEEALLRFHENSSKGPDQVKTLVRNIRTENKWIEEVWISGTDGKTRVELKDVIYCQSQNSYTTFQLTPIHKVEKCTSSVSIKDWEHSLLNSDMCRIHNRYLVNLKFVDK